MATSSSASRSYTRDIAYIAVFAALIVALGFFSIPLAAGVPIVLQNIACILAGLILGPRRGALAVALFLLLGLVGLPVLPGGRTVLSALSGPTVGYFVGYLLSAFVAGLITWSSPRKQPGFLIGLSIAVVVGVLIQYTCGTIGLVLRGTDLTAALKIQVAFLIPDAIKAVVAVSIAAAVHLARPDLRPQRTAPNITPNTAA